ncbi:hypothetical protein RND81_08G096500 [Saponaria officinalis]|uniref:Protein kinase domain-containing protein n=1 Tax=Saponaria officinalis TaxID=3572 RepID=A0AAW1J6W3_SAPOF
MGCISSKRAAPTSPALDERGEIWVKRSASHRNNTSSSIVKKFSPNEDEKIIELFDEEGEERDNERNGKRLKASKSKSTYSNLSSNLKFGSVTSQVVAEQAAAGWPGWLTAVAGEAIHGWVPLRADSFEKLEKIGQGTYSSVFRAREHATGKIVALKKVRIDNYHPESVRFMAREIMILRKLDHPNIMKLHGLITSNVSSSIYLVFDYMEHDLSGLLSSPQVTFTEAQVEQLHKIFKLCGSPPEEYWEKSKLPHATMFKPQAPYESSLRERCKILPEHTVTLLETLLSIEPQHRGTAASTLNSTYFTTLPYACDPSSLPKYPPNKEIDAKSREQSIRRTSKIQDSTTSSKMYRRGRKGLKEPSSVSMLGRPGLEESQVNRKYARRNGTNTLVTQVRKADDEISIDMKSDVSHVTNVSQGDMIFAGHRKAATLALAKTRIKEDDIFGTDTNNSTKSNMDPSCVLHANKMMDSQPKEYGDLEKVEVNSTGQL